MPIFWPYILAEKTLSSVLNRPEEVQDRRGMEGNWKDSQLVDTDAVDGWTKRFSEDHADANGTDVRPMKQTCAFFSRFKAP